MDISEITAGDKKLLADLEELFIKYYGELDCEDDPQHLFSEYLCPDLKAGLFNVAAATSGGRTIGFVIYQIDDVINDWNFKDGWGDLRELYVLPEYRGKGAGKALVDYAVRALKGQGAENIYLLPTEESEKFFLYCGFADSGEYCKEADCKVFAEKCNKKK